MLSQLIERTFQRFQGPYRSPSQKAQSRKPYRDDGMRGRLSACDPAQGIVAAAFRSRGVSTNVQPYGCKPPRAPRMHSIPLPEKQAGDQHISYNGPALGCGLTGTLDGHPKVLSPLDIPLPEPLTSVYWRSVNPTPLLRERCSRA
jgi:hypothetical protein